MTQEDQVGRREVGEEGRGRCSVVRRGRRFAAPLRSLVHPRQPRQPAIQFKSLFTEKLNQIHIPDGGEGGLDNGFEGNWRKINTVDLDISLFRDDQVGSQERIPEQLIQQIGGEGYESSFL